MVILLLLWDIVTLNANSSCRNVITVSFLYISRFYEIDQWKPHSTPGDESRAEICVISFLVLSSFL